MRPSQIAQLPEIEVRDHFAALLSSDSRIAPEDAAALLQLRGDALADWLLADYATLRQALLSESAALSSAAYVLVVKQLTAEAAPAFLEKVKPSGDRVVAETLANARPDLAPAFKAAGIDLSPRRTLAAR